MPAAPLSARRRPPLSRDPLGLGAALIALATATACPESGAVLESLRPVLDTDPASLDLDPLWAGRSTTVIVRVRNQGRAPAALSGATVEGLGGPLVVRATLLDDVAPAGGTGRVEVRLTALESQTGLGLATVRIAVDGEGELEVPVVAQVRTPPTCDDGNPCTLDRFEDGACRHDVVEDESPCDDENVCTTATRCIEGQCVGEAVTCNDDVECTLDTCDPLVGCRFEPTASRCDDDDPCTADTCVLEEGCAHEPLAEGALCLQDGCAALGFCFDGECETSPVPDGMLCDDGDPCTGTDTCQAGECVPGLPLEVGPQSPVILAEGEVYTDLCTGFFDGCWSQTWARPEQVLAAGTAADGTLLAVWRSSFVDTTTAGSCVPWADQIAFDTALRNAEPGRAEVDGDGLGGGPWPVPLPPDDGAEDRADPIPEGPTGGAAPNVQTCAAGIFVSKRSPTGLLETLQLASTRGPAAASIDDDGAGALRIAVAGTSGAESGEVMAWLFDESGQLVQTFTTWRPEQFSNPLRRIAVTQTPTMVTVVGHGAVRGGQDCLDPVACETAFCCESAIEGWSWDLSTFGTVDTFAAQVVEAVTDACVTDPFYPNPWDTLDLEAHAHDDGSVEVSFLMHPSPCSDWTWIHQAQQAYRFIRQPGEAAIPNVGPLGSPLAGAIELLPVQGFYRFAPFGESSALGVVEGSGCGLTQAGALSFTQSSSGVAQLPDCCDGDGDPTCSPCEPEPCAYHHLAHFSLTGDFLFLDSVWMTDLWAPWSIELAPLPDVEERTVLLANGQLRLVWRGTDGAMHQALAPLLDPEGFGGSWLASGGLAATGQTAVGIGQVAGTDVFTDEIPVFDQVMAQPFECQASAHPTPGTEPDTQPRTLPDDDLPPPG